MHLRKLIVGTIMSLFLANLVCPIFTSGVLADSSASYKVDVSSLNGGGTFSKSTDYHLDETTVGFVNGQMGNSAGYTLGSGLAYLELYCGNSIVEFGEQCDHGALNGTPGDTCTSTCHNVGGAVCGNGIIEAGEACDDNNVANGDGCSNVCAIEPGYTCVGAPSVCTLVPVCGNGILQAGEQCDHGAMNGVDGLCTLACTLVPGGGGGGGGGGGYVPGCGNGILDAGEQCDHGNSNGKINDSCSHQCMLLQATSKPVCGNQILESGEECDDGTKNGTPGDNCSSACLLLKPNTQPVCGNNILESGEQCDHGAKNGTVGDNCNASCEMVKSTTLPVCGNNVLESGEQCDHGTKNGTTGDSCGADCKTVSAFQIPVCGNGIKETGEECDEGLKNGVENANCTESCTMAKPGVKTPEGQGVERQIRIVAHPEKRVNASQNWSTLSRVVFYNKTLHKTELETSIELNNTGWSGFDTDKLENGTYDISLKGYSHLTKVIRDVVIDQSTETIDFTEGGKSFLIAGDVHSSKDDFIDGLDIAATVNALYSNDLSADLNHDGFVNALDLSIVVGNIYKTGERIKI